MKFKSLQTLASIAHLIQSRYVGNQNFKITGINEIHVVQPGDIVFVDHPKYYEKPGNYNCHYYYANGGHDYFISYESYDSRALFGFIRLRFVEENNMTKFDILKGRGMIRELHVYGDTQSVGVVSNNSKGCQHKGIGKGLLWLAEKKTMEQGLTGIVVISGEGVKEYYEKNGYKDIDTFMVKEFPLWKVWFYYYYANIK